ncbi:hypothetical protein NLU13_7121 [Sarocladium strictum]|uniref:Sorting nexin MVP1 n=1 Tax=Sarocladium strictum TaxID=5046 RepID=A0AA39GFA7_SARSR|nr:hypothetical protein NLU13_7121 [Sarocladium strictum]
MSLFGSTPPENEATVAGTPTRSRAGGLFDDDDNVSARQHSKKASSNSLFADEGADGSDSPWDMPSPRKQQSRAELIRNLLPAGDVPDSYIDAFDAVAQLDGNSGRVGSKGIAKLFTSAGISADAESRIKSLVSSNTGDDPLLLGRNEFNVLLALVGLAQEGEYLSLDGVDERRRNLPKPKLSGLAAEPVLPPADELGAKPPQTPNRSIPVSTSSFSPAMENPDDDPWGSPSAHRNHAHSQSNGSAASMSNGDGFSTSPPAALTTSSPVKQYSSIADVEPSPGKALGTGVATAPAAWGYFDGSNTTGPAFADEAHNPVASPFVGVGSAGVPQRTPSSIPGPRPIVRSSSSVEENILVMLMPEKEGVFMFQHHNYEVASHRRGSKVIRRYSDFVWLLDCLQKRFPFRMLPLLPPKRMAVNGNHLSNDGSFIEKRRRGLARFLNALVRHPVLGQEQLVVMFLTVPTELAVWRKQSTISVQDEFTDKPLPPGLEDSLPSTLEDLFSRTRLGVRRSAELYINTCNIMDRLVKRAEGVAADHARIAQSLIAMTETSADTYATDTNEIPLLNDGLTAMSKHLRTAQTLLEDESRGWDEGVLEDLKRQRDALVSVREMFERRERLDKDNIPYLERRIQANETKLASLRAKPEGTLKPGEIEKVAESIIKDKESIVQQHNRSIFVKECIRDELITFQSTQYHISRWNQDWAGERVKYAEMLADNWRRLLDELEGMPLGD